MQQEVDSAPFYYVGNDKIPLTADPTEFVVETEMGSAEETVRQVVARSGLVAEDIQSVGYGSHWIVRIGAGAIALRPRDIARAIREDGRISFAEPVYRGGPQNAPIWLIDRLIVRFHDRVVSDALLSEFGSRHALTLERASRPDSGIFSYRFRYPAGTGVSALAVAAAVQDDADVAWASIDGFTTGGPSFVPSDPHYQLQFHLENAAIYNGVHVDDNVEPVWDHTKGAGTKIALLDDGMDRQQVDLLGPPFNNSAWDVVNIGTTRCGENSSPYEPLGNDTHGTAIAGILGAQHNAIGVAGIAPDANINVVRVYCRTDQQFVTWADRDDIANGISWAALSVGSDVLNLSWGLDNSYGPITAAINDVSTLGRAGKGSIVVVAAGNKYPQPLPFPAYLPNVLAVGALQPTGPRASYSQGGDELDLMAPSSVSPYLCTGDVVTTDLWGARGCDDGPAGDQLNYSLHFGGTSAAAPQVAAAAALLISLNPALTGLQVRNRLKDTADPWDCIAYLCGSGKLNVHHAAYIYYPPPPSISAQIDGPDDVRPSVQCTWTASASGGSGTYSYVWRVNGGIVGYSETLDYTNSFSSGSSFSLSVEASDGVLQPGVKAIQVTVNSGAPECLIS